MTEGGKHAARESDPSVMYVSFMRASVVVAVFVLVVLGLMFRTSHQIRMSDPRNSAELKSLKAQLHKSPMDEALKARIRTLDARLRTVYLRGLGSAHTGGHLLIIGIAGLLLAVSGAAQYRKRIILPSGLSDESDKSDSLRASTQAERRAVAVLGSVAAVGLVALAITSRGDLNSGYARAVREYRSKPPQDFTAPAASSAVSSPAATASTTAAAAPTNPAPTGTAAVGGPVGAVTPLPPMSGAKTAQGATASPTTSAKPAPVSRAHPAEPKPVALTVEAAFDASDYSPSAEEFAANWGVFRGPLAGVASGSYPVSWDGSVGNGILWKTEIPLPGWNSPVVWKDRVYLAGADKASREIYCVSADDGKMLWKQSVEPLVKAKAPDVNADTGYAAPTLAADDRRVFAIFPNGDVFGYSADGKRLWGRNLGTPDSMYGYASSLTMFRNLLIIQYDQGSGSDGKSLLLALQGSTGKVVWVTKRPVASSWSSPLVVRSGDGGMVITSANPWSIAYDALTGKELWRASVLSGDVAPSPAYAGSMAYVCNSGAVLAAIRADGRGDVTKSHVVWRASDGLPDITSPATDGDLLFLLTTEGLATCYDAKQGERIWDHTFDLSFGASPVIVGVRVYLLDRDGLMHVIDAKRTFREETRSPLGEAANATPAFVGGRIFIRGEKHLFCIGTKS